MKTRIGYMPYLNAEPFYYHLNLSGDSFEFCRLVPSNMALSAGKGAIDAGPLPLVACFNLEDSFVPLGDFCIASIDVVQSILLFCRRPVEELANCTFAVTGESVTSVQLLKVLLHHKYRVSPKSFTSLQKDNDAFLLIGDCALRERTPKSEYPYCYDLGKEWYDWTGLPFVFARWIVRKELPQEIKDDLCAQLSVSLEKGLIDLDAIAHKRNDLGLSKTEVINYLEGFHYTLGAKEHEAMRQFRQLLYTLPVHE